MACNLKTCFVCDIRVSIAVPPWPEPYLDEIKILPIFRADLKPFHQLEDDSRDHFIKYIFKKPRKTHRLSVWGWLFPVDKGGLPELAQEQVYVLEISLA